MLDRPPARPRAQPRGAHRDRPRPHRRSPGVRELRRELPRQHAAAEVNWTCDVCGGEVVQRDDDTEEAVATPARALRAPDGADHRLLPRASGSSSSVDGVGDGDEVFRAPDQGDRRALRPCSASDHAQERRPDRADAPRGQGGRGDARGVHPRREAGRDARSTSTPRRARCSTERGARSNFLGYHGFPAVVCTSPNEVIVHGIPSDDVVLEDGDILSIDCGAIIEGWHADAAVTVPVGEIDDESKRLIEVTRALARGGDRRRWSRATGSATSAPRSRASPSAAGFTRGARVRRPRHRHRHARGPAGARTTGPPGKGMKLKEGHVLAIEPMVNAGSRRDRGARRRLDRRHRRRPPLRPLRAHHRRHRPRPRGPHPPW